MPLSPYTWTNEKSTFTDTTYDYSDFDDSTKIMVKYFLVKGYTSDTAKLKDAINTVADSIVGNALKEYDSIQLMFYKASKKLNESYIESDINPLDDFYETNFIAMATWWRRGGIHFISFYKNGKIINAGKDVELKSIK